MSIKSSHRDGQPGECRALSPRSRAFPTAATFRDGRAPRVPPAPFSGRRVMPPRTTKAPRLQGFLHGRYWARTSDPQLVDSGQRSRPFARVRSRRMVERNPVRDRTPERTRTNVEPCHSCHADETREPHLSSPSRRCCARVRPARGIEGLAPEASAYVDVGDLDCVVAVAEPVPGWNVGLSVAGCVGCSCAE